MTPRDTVAVRAALLALVPSGWAWPHGEDSRLAALLTAPAAEISAAETGWLQLLAEVADPRQANTLLEDFERVLGPDACGRDQMSQTTDSRRRLAHQRWTARGGSSRAYFIDLAALLGVEITIEEPAPSEAGLLECAFELTPEDHRFVWVVHLPATVLIEFETGVAEAGAPLGDFVPSLLECVIRDQVPAHTLPVFSYPEAE